MKLYFYLAYFHCQVVISFMQNTLVLPFNIDLVSTLSITLVKSFQIHICQYKDKFYGLQSSRCEINKCQI